MHKKSPLVRRTMIAFYLYIYVNKLKLMISTLVKKLATSDYFINYVEGSHTKNK